MTVSAYNKDVNHIPLIVGDQAMSRTLFIDPSDQKPEPVLAAPRLEPDQRVSLAIQVLGSPQSVSELSRAHNVSRKFVYAQAHKAKDALDEAFDSSDDDAEVLFFLPVTKTWLRQLALALILICHASFRGVVELFRDLFDTSISVGSVHNIVAAAVDTARQVNATEALSLIRVGAHDEIFQNRKPILVGSDVYSTYCYLLAEEKARDSTTWGVHLLELQERGLHLDHSIADFGKGLRAGQRQAWPDVPCWGDLFHAVQQMRHLSTYLENQAMGAISTREKLETKMQTAKKKAQGHTLSKKLTYARKAEERAIDLSDDIALLLQWMQDDILALVGPSLPTREVLYDFVVAELREKAESAPHHITPVVRTLENGRDDLLAFVKDQEKRLLLLAQQCQVSPHLIQSLYECQAIPETDPRRWQQEGELRHLLGDRFYHIEQALTHIIETTVRASSVIENLNSRLRNYFFLRKQLGEDYLDLLRFFLNHRRFMRSEHPERAGKSPAEILTGQEQPHWLHLLGFRRFKKTG